MKPETALIVASRVVDDIRGENYQVTPTGTTIPIYQTAGQGRAIAIRIRPLGDTLLYPPVFMGLNRVATLDNGARLEPGMYHDFAFFLPISNTPGERFVHVISADNTTMHVQWLLLAHG